MKLKTSWLAIILLIAFNVNAQFLTPLETDTSKLGLFLSGNNYRVFPVDSIEHKPSYSRYTFRSSVFERGPNKSDQLPYSPLGRHLTIYKNGLWVFDTSHVNHPIMVLNTRADSGDTWFFGPDSTKVSVDQIDYRDDSTMSFTVNDSYRITVNEGFGIQGFPNLLDFDAGDFSVHSRRIPTYKDVYGRSPGRVVDYGIFSDRFGKEMDFYHVDSLIDRQIKGDSITHKIYRQVYTALRQNFDFEYEKTSGTTYSSDTIDISYKYTDEPITHLWPGVYRESKDSINGRYPILRTTTIERFGYFEATTVRISKHSSVYKSSVYEIAGEGSEVLSYRSGLGDYYYKDLGSAGVDEKKLFYTKIYDRENGKRVPFLKDRHDATRELNSVISIAPNPVRTGGLLTLHLKNGYTGNLTIHDMEGRLVCQTKVQSEQSQLPVSLAPGSYVVKALVGSSSVVHRLIVTP